MAEKFLSSDDCVLLRLMDQIKPHLKPYAYRQDAWLRVLNKYNELTGSAYRQARTLRVKFEKMKGLCVNGKRGNMGIEDFELLSKLASEVGGKESKRRYRKKIRSARKSSQAQETGGSDSLIIEQTFSNTRLRADRAQENVITASSGEGSQPPPLDSIAVGFSLVCDHLEQSKSMPRYELFDGQGDKSSLRRLEEYSKSERPYQQEVFSKLNEIDDDFALNQGNVNEEKNTVGFDTIVKRGVGEQPQHPPLDSITVGFAQSQPYGRRPPGNNTPSLEESLDGD